MNKTLHKSIGKLKHIVGIGGAGCPCCTLGPKRVMKRLWNRIQRRMLLRELVTAQQETNQ